jgi:hypothetical protein
MADKEERIAFIAILLLDQAWMTHEENPLPGVLN